MMDAFDVWFVVERVLLAAALAWLLTRDILNRRAISDLEFRHETLREYVGDADTALVESIRILNSEDYRDELAEAITVGIEREFTLQRRVFDESGGTE